MDKPDFVERIEAILERRDETAEDPPVGNIEETGTSVAIVVGTKGGRSVEDGGGGGGGGGGRSEEEEEEGGGGGGRGKPLVDTSVVLGTLPVSPVLMELRRDEGRDKDVAAIFKAIVAAREAADTLLLVAEEDDDDDDDDNRRFDDDDKVFVLLILYRAMDDE